MIEMTWFLDCSLQEEKPDGRQLSLSSGNYNKVIKPQVNGNSLNICRYKSDTVGKWPKGKCLLIHFPPKLSVTNEHHLIESEQLQACNLAGTVPGFPCVAVWPCPRNLTFSGILFPSFQWAWQCLSSEPVHVRQLRRDVPLVHITL